MASPSTADDVTGPAPGRTRPSDGPVVIEARGIQKSFRIPEHRIDSLKERVAHPLTRIEYREHRALRDVSFDVHQGEFFGIVGRNGSGKSSLLKILASIYRADAGRVRTAGRVAPFLELGVGLNPELTARENGVLNGVLMGMTLREARRRFDEVIEFAELEDFVDLKLKNYSSGMMVRFAFAVTVWAEADIMLIDEVLAVGDAAFAEKCMDVFRERRAAGKTIVLVTHDMTTVQMLCHRAMLLHDGEIRYLGEPEDAALQYYKLNFAAADADAALPGAIGAKIVDVNARVIQATLRGEAGEAVDSLPAGAPLDIDVQLEAARTMERPRFIFHVRNADGHAVFEFTHRLGEWVEAGRRVRLAGRVENPLVGGRYSLDVYIREEDEQGGMTVQGLRLLHFAIEGAPPPEGMVSVRSDVDAVLEARPE
jgi:ABC-2 type transport system ATP-binding protein